MTRLLIILGVGGLCAISFAVSFFTTLAMKRWAPKLGWVDRPGGRKIHDNPKPLLGGVGIFLGFGLPMLVGLLAITWGDVPPIIERMLGNAARSIPLSAYWSGAQERTPMALGMVLAGLCLHLLGVWDDRKALGPYFKLGVQLIVVTALVAMVDLRALTALDQLGLGRVPSIAVTVLWITAITNAFNFLDNMDGLSAGVAAVCTTAFLVTALSIQQWFVAAALMMLLGALLGFLCFNFPPATIFMGDAGSMVIGFLLGVLTVRTTYLAPGERLGAGWYEVFAPVIVLAVPLYDLLVVCTIRMLSGKSPFRPDTNHFSHRLVARGMSKRTAVLCLYLISAATAIAAVILPHARSSFIALCIFVQTLLILGVVALLEQHPLPIVKSRAISAEELMAPVAGKSKG